MKRFLALSADFVVIVSIALLVGCTRPSPPVRQRRLLRDLPRSARTRLLCTALSRAGPSRSSVIPAVVSMASVPSPTTAQCEEWALLRGECPKGGIRVAGCATPAARYCGITGGSYTVVARSGAADEQARARCRAARRATRRRTTAGRAAGRVRLRSADSASSFVSPSPLVFLRVFVSSWYLFRSANHEDTRDDRP